MALPWLESFNVWGDEPRKNKPASEAPVRLAVTVFRQRFSLEGMVGEG